MKIFFLVFFLINFSTLFSQSVLMQNGSISQCSGTFYDAGGVSANYDNNENYVLTICPPTAGDIIQLDFKVFSTQADKDILTIYDGDSVSAPSLGSFSGGALNSPGLIRATSTNPSGCLTLKWTSDGDGLTTGWAADISCLTLCQNIKGSIDTTVPAYDTSRTVIANSNEMVTFNASGTFSTSSVGATYNWDFGDGTMGVGEMATHAYANNGKYFVTLIIKDSNPLGCESLPIRLTVQVGASSPGNPNVNAGEDVIMECGQTCTDIKATFLEIGETSSYEVSAIPFVPPFPFKGLSNSLNPDNDDSWSNVENLPFEFCFFNNIETKFQIGSNGAIRFDVNSSDISNAWEFDQNIPNNSAEALREANVFTPVHDLDPTKSTSEQIAWEIIGTAPNRVLAVSFYEVPLYYYTEPCGDMLATHMAVFYETTNVIDIYIKSKPACEWNNSYAVVGIQNHAGNKAFVPPGRNTRDSPWTAVDEAWRFTPVGSSIIDFAWLDQNGNIVGTTPILNVCPIQETTYTARVSYTSCNGVIVTVTDDVKVGVDRPFLVDLGPDQNLCLGASDLVLNGAINSATATYQWSKNGIDLVGESNPDFTISSPNDGIYTLSVTDNSCTLSDNIEVAYFEIPVANSVSEYQLCEDEVIDGFTEFDLTLKNNEIIGSQTNVGVAYFASQSDADANTNPLSNLYKNLNNPQTIYARIENGSAGNCYDTTSFNLSVGQGIVLGQPDVLTACDDSSNDGFAVFDLSVQDAVILNGLTDVSLSYHTSLSDAETNTNPISVNYTNTVTPQTIYGRVQNNSNSLCFKIVVFDLDVLPLPYISGPTSLVICEKAESSVAQFTLSDVSSAIIAGQTGVEVSYYESEDNATAGVAPLPDLYTSMSSSQTIYVRLENTTTKCAVFSTLTLRVYDIPVPGENPPDIIICDDNNPGDMIERLNLSENETYIANGQTGVTVTYYLDAIDAEALNNPIIDPINYSNSESQETIYARLTNNLTGCYAVVDFDIFVNPVPKVVAVTDYIICEDNMDDVASFDLTSKDDEVLNGQDSNQYEVSYHTSQSDADFLLNALTGPYQNTSNPQRIYVALTNTATGCSTSTTGFLLEVQEAAEAYLPTPYIVCDLIGDNDGLGQFDLATKDAEILSPQDPAIYTVNYYTNETDAENGVNSIPKLYENITNPQTVYARVDIEQPNSVGLDSSICYAVTPLTLRVNLLPIVDLDENYTLCLDTNGTEILDLPILNTGLSTAGYTFDWYLDGVLLNGEAGGSLTASASGSYNVNVTSKTTGCSNLDTAQVKESRPPQLTAELTTALFSDTHNIKALATGTGTYEYSLDAGPWQESGIFVSVSSGQHMVTARDVLGCGMTSTTVFVLDYPNYFTPNGDGYNETWNIVGFDAQPNAKILIFDRYGKLLKQIMTSGSGWNGTFNGQLMPSDDYWFILHYNDPVTGQKREFKSHFSLRR